MAPNRRGTSSGAGRIGSGRPVGWLVAAVVAAAGAAVVAAVTAYAVSWSGAGATRCAAPALAGTTVRVTETDMGGMAGGMMGRGGARNAAITTDPGTVPAGTVSLEVTNAGMRTHELVVLPLPAGQVAGARQVLRDDTVNESGSLGEASRSCGAGHGEGITAGATGWVTLRLAPGRYELVCNLPGHYRRGMSTELDVT